MHTFLFAFQSFICGQTFVIVLNGGLKLQHSYWFRKALTNDPK